MKITLEVWTKEEIDPAQIEELECALMAQLEDIPCLYITEFKTEEGLEPLATKELELYNDLNKKEIT